jgi:D-alanyl-D-alanine-carboxypeptidase/D-alanyl-D-alanine-endopeptidase
VLPTAQSIPPNTPPHRIGTKFAYSNIGIVLLGHLISLRAGSNYEALLVSQICEPLRMNSARIMLSPDLKARLAMWHSGSGPSGRNFNAPLSLNSGGIVSSANGMLKFIAAILGLTNGSLADSMQKTHEV